MAIEVLIADAGASLGIDIIATGVMRARGYRAASELLLMVQVLSLWPLSPMGSSYAMEGCHLARAVGRDVGMDEALGEAWKSTYSIRGSMPSVMIHPGATIRLGDGHGDLSRSNRDKRINIKVLYELIEIL